MANGTMSREAFMAKNNGSLTFTNGHITAVKEGKSSFTGRDGKEHQLDALALQVPVEGQEKPVTIIVTGEKQIAAAKTAVEAGGAFVRLTSTLKEVVWNGKVVKAQQLRHLWTKDRNFAIEVQEFQSKSGKAGKSVTMPVTVCKPGQSAAAKLTAAEKKNGFCFHVAESNGTSRLSCSLMGQFDLADDMVAGNYRPDNHYEGGFRSATFFTKSANALKMVRPGARLLITGTMGSFTAQDGTEVPTVSVNNFAVLQTAKEHEEAIAKATANKPQAQTAATGDDDGIFGEADLPFGPESGDDANDLFAEATDEDLEIF